MLQEMFYWVLNMSIIASVFGILIYFLRYIKGFPKLARYALWAVVILRAICPIGVSSKYSLLNILVHAAEKTYVKTIPVGGIEDMVQISPRMSLSNALQGAATYQPITYKTNVLEEFFQIASVVWVILAAAAILAMIILYLLTKAELTKAQHIQDNIYQSPMVNTPTVYGIIKPKIVLPCEVDKEYIDDILLHENVHIRRHDNLWRMAVILISCIHWFNPLCWLFLKIFLEDCELACDEAAVKKMTSEERKNYAKALLACAAKDRIVFSSAFGSSRVKVRIQNILTYQKLTLFSIICFSGMVLAVAYLLLTNAMSS